MATVSLLSKIVKTSTDAGIDGNGQFELFNSGLIANNNDRNSLRVVVEYCHNLPNPEVTPINYKLYAVVESSDGNDSWYPLINQFEGFFKEEAGRKHILTIEPGIFNLDEGVPVYDALGNNTIAVESRKQGHLSDDFRIRIVVEEYGYGSTGAFQEAELNCHYEIYDA